MIFISEDGKQYPANQRHLINGETGPLRLQSDLVFNKKKIHSHVHSLWRYLEMLAVDESSAKSMGEGWTPFSSIVIANTPVWVKHEQLAPTGSYKDRGSAVLMAYLKQMGVKEVVQDSSGNAGASIAAYAALQDIRCTIIVPQSTSPTKLKQISHYGARIIQVEGNREAAALKALELAKTTDYASHCYHPMFFEGTKTFAYEMAEQNDWSVPDTVVLPAGNGSLLLGSAIGFKEMHAAGIIAKTPKIIAVQTARCAPLYALWNHTEFKPSKDPGLSEGIAIAQPVRLKQMFNAIHESGGMVLTVNENDIESCYRKMGKKGYFIEPTSAAIIAGTEKYIQLHASDSETIATLFSGHGLKKTL